MTGAQKLIDSAEETIRRLWFVRPVQCIELQAAIEQYKDALLRSKRKKVHIKALDHVMAAHAQTVRS